MDHTFDPENDVVQFWTNKCRAFKEEKLPRWVTKGKQYWTSYKCEVCKLTRTECLKMIATYSRLNLIAKEVAAYLINLLNTETPPMAVLLSMMGQPTA